MHASLDISRTEKNYQHCLPLVLGFYGPKCLNLFSIDWQKDQIKFFEIVQKLSWSPADLLIIFYCHKELQVAVSHFTNYFQIIFGILWHVVDTKLTLWPV